VKFLEDVGYQGSRHFDAHAYRTEDVEGVKDFARGCMRTYLILKDKAKQWNADKEIQALVREISGTPDGVPRLEKFSKESTAALFGRTFDKDRILQRRLPYEKLDQLTMDLLLGVR
jgi:xylose isomerase